METRKIQTGILTRQFDVQGIVNESERTVEIAFSSEMPAHRAWGIEVLDHSANSVDLSRMNDGAPVLWNHDWDQQIGVVKNARIDSDRVGRATIKFSRSQLGEEVYQDVLDGIRSKVSVGYTIQKMQEENDFYRAVDWHPLEVSIVSIPMDNTVGVGRNADFKNNQTQIESKTMEQEQKIEATAQKIDVSEERAQSGREERARVNELMAVAKQYREHGAMDIVDGFIQDGRSVGDFNGELMKRISASHKIEKSDIGMTEEEVRSFSFIRAINALANPTDQRAQSDASFEFAVSRAAQKQYGKETRGLLLPTDILRRDLTVGTTTAGGHTVATDLMSQSFIDMLINSTVVYPVVTKMMGLVGNVAIPRQTGGATAYWVAESGAPTESQQAFDQVAMSPETVGAFTDFSRKLTLQSSVDIEAFVRRDLARTLGLEIDRVCINGSGSSNQPTGILNTTGIGSVVGGTNGLAPAWSHIVDLETQIAQDNADVGSLYYVTNTKVRGKLKQTEKASGTAQFVWDGGTLNGYNTLVSNQVPSNLTKGTASGICSAIIFGNFADMIVGMWSGLDLLVDPYTGGTAGTVRVIVHQDMDLVVRHAESFAAMVDALT